MKSSTNNAIKTGTHKRTKTERTDEELQVVRALRLASIGLGVSAVHVLRANAGSSTQSVDAIADLTDLDHDRVRPTLLRLRRQGRVEQLGRWWGLV